MSYSLTLDPDKVLRESEDLGSINGRRRFSLSTPGELHRLPSHNLARAGSFSGNEMTNDLNSDGPSQSPKVNLNPPYSSSRVERLLRERQIRKSSSCYQLGDSEPSIQNENKNCESPLPDSKSLSHESFSPADTPPSSNPPIRLIVVANRLPVSTVLKPDDSWSLELSAGGLVSALLGVKQNFETCWIGWPGVYLKSEKDRKMLTDALKSKGCVPVFLDEQTVDQYYNGYCNNILWPLFHYLGLPQEYRLAATRSVQSQYSAYKRANELFADVVMSQYNDGDVVWCHDYHLMLLPSYLKERKAEMKVGWFLHTPFPSSEIYRTLPLRAEILKASLAADLVGFHTYDYARHYVSACTRVLGFEGTPDGVENQGKLTRVSAFPIGIDPDRFIQSLESTVVKNHISELQARFAGRKVMLGVDRLDMIKGIPQKLLAFEKFLEENPKWRDKVLLVQIAVPSRTDVSEYQKLRSNVHEIVGRINGKFGTLTTVPIHHLDRNLNFLELCALYAITDVSLITSLRDGMNLVSYEFVACQNQKKGVLILSEFAGAAQSLGAGAILVNPWNISEMANAIGDALDMPEEERTERHRHNFMHVMNHTAQAWADTFVSELNDTVYEAELRTLRVPPLLPTMDFVKKFFESTSRLLILGFSGALTATSDDFKRKKDQFKEMKVRPHPLMAEILKVLSNDPNTTIIILSGSERAILDEVFSDFDVWLAAENGMFLRHTKGEWMTTMPEHFNMEWVESVQLVFEYFCERTPRSYVEARETSLLWNYKYADVEFGRVQARDMLQHLWTGPISNAAVDVVQGSKSVEVRPVGLSKGAAIERIIGEIVHEKGIKTPIDFVFCCGHFLSKDEDIYTFFEPNLPLEDGGSSHRGSVGGLAEGRGNLNHKTHKSKEFYMNSKKSINERYSRTKSSSVGFGSNSPGSTPPSTRLDAQTLSSRLTNGRDYGMYVNSFAGSPVENGDPASDTVPIMDLSTDQYFSCAVGRKVSQARFSLPGSQEVVEALKLVSDRMAKRLSSNMSDDLILEA